ncbi:MAG: globin [Planctomycetes bacterium]|nr:globin [Planctomycetota bacterium]
MTHPPDPVADVCDRVGEDSIRAVTRAFYAQIPDDPILAPLYPEHDFDGAEERLADFLVMRFGGSTRYAETRGHPRLRMRHVPFHIGQAERDRWVQLMDRALDTELGDAEVRERVREFLHGVATFLINAPDR